MPLNQSLYGLLILSLLSWNVVGQEATIQGTITDANTEEPLIGVNVIVDEGAGTTTNFEGKYKTSVEPGTHQITYKFVGYKKQTKDVSIEKNETKTFDIRLSEKTEELDIVVVSASKFEKKLGEETVSIDVLDSDQIDNSNAVDAEEAMQKVPGVTITDGQANIRGGSGWSYGSGSRVLMLVDGVPLMTPHGGGIKWNLIPVENVKQIEVIKGAASALYGSSALNGVINVRTQWPGKQPETEILSYAGMYGSPPDDELKWWDNNQPSFMGGRFVHRQKFNRIDFVLGGSYLKNTGFKQSSGKQGFRVNLKTRYRPKNIKGLSLGVKSNFYRSVLENWFLWNGVDSMGYLPLPNSVSQLKTIKMRVDPFATYFDSKGNQFSLKLRYFNTTNKDNTNQGSVNNKYYGQFTFRRRFKDPGINFVTGVSGFYTDVSAPDGASEEESLVGNHNGSNGAYFVQADKKFFTRLNVSLGFRFEFFQIDSFRTDSELKAINNVFNTDITSPIKPVARLGLNYQLYEETYLRASFGQGYRFPSIAEKFVNTNVGNIGIFSNPKLESETGWTAEVGIKQGIKLGEWSGYVDLAGFVNQYDDMMEFTFGQLGGPDDALNGIGFSSQNVGKTRIAGGELTVQGKGKIFGAPTTLIAGYTFIEPESLNWNDTLTLYKANGEKLEGINTYAETSSSDDNFLKYRHRHTLKIDLESQIDKLSVGGGIQFKSFMENIDKPFVTTFTDLESLFNSNAFSGLKKYRDNREGTWDKILNLRAGYQLTERLKTTFIVKNVLNDDYTVRPGLFGEPRNYTLQLKMSF